MKIATYNPQMDGYQESSPHLPSGAAFFVEYSGANEGDRYFPETQEEFEYLLSRRPVAPSNTALGSMLGPFYKR